MAEPRPEPDEPAFDEDTIVSLTPMAQQLLDQLVDGLSAETGCTLTRDDVGAALRQLKEERGTDSLDFNNPDVCGRFLGILRTRQGC